MQLAQQIVGVGEWVENAALDELAFQHSTDEAQSATQQTQPNRALRISPKSVAPKLQSCRDRDY